MELLVRHKRMFGWIKQMDSSLKRL